VAIRQGVDFTASQTLGQSLASVTEKIYGVYSSALGLAYPNVFGLLNTGCSATSGRRSDISFESVDYSPKHRRVGSSCGSAATVAGCSWASSILLGCASTAMCSWYTTQLCCSAVAQAASSANITGGSCATPHCAGKKFFFNLMFAYVGQSWYDGVNAGDPQPGVGTALLGGDSFPMTTSEVQTKLNVSSPCQTFLANIQNPSYHLLSSQLTYSYTGPNLTHYNYTARCDTSYPENGKAGTCAGSLASGATCTPECNPGFELKPALASNCTNGVFGTSNCTKRILPTKYPAVVRISQGVLFAALSHDAYTGVTSAEESRAMERAFKCAYARMVHSSFCEGDFVNGVAYDPGVTCTSTAYSRRGYATLISFTLEIRSSTMILPLIEEAIHDCCKPGMYQTAPNFVAALTSVMTAGNFIFTVPSADRITFQPALIKDANSGSKLSTSMNGIAAITTFCLLLSSL